MLLPVPLGGLLLVWTCDKIFGSVTASWFMAINGCGGCLTMLAWWVTGIVFRF